MLGRRSSNDGQGEIGGKKGHRGEGRKHLEVKEIFELLRREGSSAGMIGKEEGGESERKSVRVKDIRLNKILQGLSQGDKKGGEGRGDLRQVQICS